VIRDEIDRVPTEDTRLRRALDKMRAILNDLLRKRVIIRVSDEEWDINYPLLSQASGNSYPTFLIDEHDGGDDVFLRGPKGEAGAAGATGPTGPAGSGSGAGSGGWPAETIGDGMYCDAGEVALSHSQQRFNLTNDSGQFLNGTGQFAVIGTANAYDVNLSVTAPQTVTNSTTFVDATELTHSVTSGSIWWYYCWILYSGNNVSTDFKPNWHITAGTFNSIWKYNILQSQTDTFSVNFARTVGGTDFAASAAHGTDAANTVRFAWYELMVQYSADATASFQFANVTAAGVGTSCTLEAGTKIRGLRIL
jgi:hypothetical protein